MESPYSPPSEDHLRRGQQYDFVPANTRGLVTFLFIGLIVGTAITLLDVMCALTIPTWNDPNAAPSSDFEVTAINLALAGGLLYIVVFVVTIVLFCIWIHRANRNARALGAQGMAFTPGWCVGWWFVPFLNLFKPYQAVKELYLASDSKGGPEGWQAAAAPRVFALWWSTWIIANLASNAELRLGIRDDPQLVEASSWFGAVGTVFSIPSCFAVVWIIKAIERRQLVTAGWDDIDAATDGISAVD